MSQCARVALWVPTANPAEVGDAIKTTGAPGLLKQIATQFFLPGAGGSFVPEAPTDGEQYARKNATWSVVTHPASLPDAPADGQTYGRKNTAWVVVTGTGGGGGVEEAPIDG